MRKTSTLIAIALGATALLSGCSTVSPTERARVGATFELTQPWCHAEFTDGTRALFPEKCVTVVRPASFKKVELPAGTCLKLVEANISYPELDREVVYDVEVAGMSSTITGTNLPGAKLPRGLVPGTCAYEPSTYLPKS